ncbi:glycoside hydrolase family 3 N-terminal domain-containing protein (plasmid) [Coraliomargarita sp. W4R53]
MTTKRRVAASAAAAAMLVALSVTPATAASPDPSAPQQEITGVVRAQAAADSDVSDAAVARVASMSTQEKAASVVMGHIPSTDAETLRAYMNSTDIGGFIMMGANVPSTEGELRELTAALTVDPMMVPLIAIDQEGGDVSRLPWDDFPSALTLKNEPAQDAQDAFAARAGLVMRAGIGVNFGIVADETDDPSMFIYRRALGTTPDSAAERVAASVSGEGATAMSTLKHFPGHGAAPGDSHSGIPQTSMSLADWATSDAVPFAAGIDAGAPLLMFGHLRYTTVDAKPATMSAKWHEIARDDLGFDGVSITDDLGMLEASGLSEYEDPVRNAVEALAAGNDMLLTVLYSDSNTAQKIVDGIVAAVGNGSVPGERLTQAAEQVTSLRLELSAAGRGLMPCANCDPAG